jgi:hypothetical protein
VGYLLVTRLQVDMLIRNAVETSTGVDKDARNFIASPATLAGKHLGCLLGITVPGPRSCDVEQVYERVFG